MHISPSYLRTECVFDRNLFSTACIFHSRVSEQNVFLVADMMRTAITGSGSWSKNTYWRGTGWRANTLLQRKDLAGKVRCILGHRAN